MAAIRYLVPYQVDLFHTEDETEQRIMNTFYLKSDVQTTTPPAYGLPILGSGSTATMLSNVNSLWAAGPLTELSAHAEFLGSRCRAMLGYAYPTALRAISSASIVGSIVMLTTSTPHGFSTGNIVLIANATGTMPLNGSWMATVIDNLTFSITGPTPGTYLGGGTVQSATGQVSFVYGDNDELVDSANGGVVGQMLPAYVSVDVRRINSGVGRSYRSRIGFGPIGEASQSGGKLEPGSQASIDAAFATFINIGNGGTDATSNKMNHYALSKQRAFIAANPFIQSAGFTAPVQSFSARLNLGSQNSRKARSGA